MFMAAKMVDIRVKDVSELIEECPDCKGKIYYEHYTAKCEDCEFKEDY